MDGKSMAIEALVDNDESSILVDTMKQIEWPADSEFCALRTFLMVQEIGN